MIEVTLPGGFASARGWERAVWLRPWDGRDEWELLADAGESPAAQATALLARCLALEGGARPASAEFVRGLTVGDREALLLHLRRITVGDPLPCLIGCPSCGERMELDLSTRALLLAPYAWEGEWHRLDGGGADESAALQFRLPTGADQEAAARLAEAPDAAARLIGDRCLRPRSAGDAIAAGSGAGVAMDASSPPSDAAGNGAQLDRLGAAMAERDPQAEVRLALRCPACAAEFETVLDAFTHIKTEIERSRRGFHREVHLLALHYHWSELDILAMNPSRRRAYVEELLDGMQGRGVA